VSDVPAAGAENFRPAHELPLHDALHVRVLLGPNAVARATQLLFVIALETEAAHANILGLKWFLGDRATHLSRTSDGFPTTT
jgi:hypothetical protein